MTDRERRVVQHARCQGYMYKAYAHEADLLAHCKQVLGMLGAVCVRVDHVSEGGVADLIICYKGRYIAAELKAANGTPSASQLLFIQKVRKAGGTAALVRTVAELFELVLIDSQLNQESSE